jgi:hypothetical protein
VLFVRVIGKQFLYLKNVVAHLQVHIRRCGLKLVQTASVCVFWWELNSVCCGNGYFCPTSVRDAASS